MDRCRLVCRNFQVLRERSPRESSTSPAAFKVIELDSGLPRVLPEESINSLLKTY